MLTQFFCFSLYLFGALLLLKYWAITNMLSNLRWITNIVTMPEISASITVWAIFFSKQDSLFIAWCISDRGCCYSTLVLMILQRFRVNMSLWVRGMIASACRHDLHDQLIYLLPSLTERAEHKALSQWILCFYYCKNGHFYTPSQCATHPINFSLFISTNCLKSEVYLSKILEKKFPESHPETNICLISTKDFHWSSFQICLSQSWINCVLLHLTWSSLLGMGQTVSNHPSRSLIWHNLVQSVMQWLDKAVLITIKYSPRTWDQLC